MVLRLLTVLGFRIHESTRKLLTVLYGRTALRLCRLPTTAHLSCIVLLLRVGRSSIPMIVFSIAIFTFIPGSVSVTTPGPIDDSDTSAVGRRLVERRRSS
jgi:hypothetical protein